MQISVKRFLELTIKTFSGYFDGITAEEAKVIQQEDKLETFCHVQLMPNGKDYRLWAIQDWRLDYQKQQHDKHKANERRREYDKERRNVKAITNYLVSMSGLTEQEVTSMANVMLKNQRSVEALGIKLED